MSIITATVSEKLVARYLCSKILCLIFARLFCKKEAILLFIIQLISLNLSIQIDLNLSVDPLLIEFQILKIYQLSKEYNLQEFKNKVQEKEI